MWIIKNSSYCFRSIELDFWHAPLSSIPFFLHFLHLFPGFHLMFNTSIWFFPLLEITSFVNWSPKWRFVHSTGTFYWTYDFHFCHQSKRHSIFMYITNIIVHVSSVFNINNNFTNELLLFMKFYDQKHMRTWNRKYWTRVSGLFNIASFHLIPFQMLFRVP